MNQRRRRKGSWPAGRRACLAIAGVLVLAAPPAGSQIRQAPGEASNPDAEAGAIAPIETAAEVADQVREPGDAAAMPGASRMMAEVHSRARTGDAPFVISSVLLDEAKALAAGDPNILLRTQRLQSPDKGVRSSPFGPGPIVLVRRLRAGETYSFTVEARRNEVLRVAAIGDGDTNIDLTIRDSLGAVVCSDGSRDHYPVCTLTRPQAGTLRVEVLNRGAVWSRVQILTN